MKKTFQMREYGIQCVTEGGEGNVHFDKVYLQVDVPSFVHSSLHSMGNDGSSFGRSASCV